MDFLILHDLYHSEYQLYTTNEECREAREILTPCQRNDLRASEEDERARRT